MASMPIITIGITCYNSADTIERAVNSARAQDWAHKEIIIVDDASRDGSQDILRALEEECPELRVIVSEQNKGVASARNMLIEHARGEFLAFFDDDDESLPERLTVQRQRIVDYEAEHSDKDPVICYSARRQLYPGGGERVEPTIGCSPGVAPHGPEVAARILTGRPPSQRSELLGAMATCSQMARLSVYKELGGFDPNFRRSEDTELNIRASISGAHFVGIAKPLVQQTMTYGSDKALKAEKTAMLQLMEKHRDIVSRYSSFEFCQKWIKAKYQYYEGQKLCFVWSMFCLALAHPALTAKRLIWALPNMGFNRTFRKFHQNDAQDG